jgi:hypothetical protein
VYAFLKGAGSLMTGEDCREKMIEFLGEENVGFWAIFDQIIFLEEMLLEVST